MRVGQRLFLAVMPAVLGVFTVAGLAYWGRYAHTAPRWLVVIAVVAAIGSLLVAWSNTRYVAQRIERLASARSAPSPRPVDVAGLVVKPGGPDELDAIEQVVDHLSSAVGAAEANRQASLLALRAREGEYAALLAGLAKGAMSRLDEVRLPLHILLENRFGDLNENQEEMLGAARAAVEEAQAEFERLREIAELDQGTLQLRRDAVRMGDVVTTLLPALRAEATAAGARRRPGPDPAGGGGDAPRGDASRHGRRRGADHRRGHRRRDLRHRIARNWRRDPQRHGARQADRGRAPGVGDRHRKRDRRSPAAVVRCRRGRSGRRHAAPTRSMGVASVRRMARRSIVSRFSLPSPSSQF
jgi:signal transduction histidine kinase